MPTAMGRPLVAALNHLLTRNDWALPRLARFSGRTVVFDIAPFSIPFTVRPDGLLQVAEEGSLVDARCVIAPSLLPRLALQDESAHAEIFVSGNSALLSEVFFLARHLRWDAAEDLSRLTGDIVAERIVQMAQSGRQQIFGTAFNLSHALAEYWTEESPLLAKPDPVSTFIRRVATLRDDVARLEQRLGRLSSG